MPRTQRQRLYRNSGAVDVPGRGDDPDNPIDVDNNNWFSGHDISGIESDEYDAGVDGKFDNSNCAPKSEESMDAESLAGNMPSSSSSLREKNGDTLRRMEQKQVHSWMPRRKQMRSRLGRTGVGREMGSLGCSAHARAAIGRACSSRNRYNPKSTLSPDEKEAMNLYCSGSETGGPGPGRSTSQHVEGERALSESPFLIPDGEEALWHEPGAFSDESRKNQIFTEDSHPAEVGVHRAITTKADTPCNADLCLDLFIGDMNFVRHASIEPKSVQFRRWIVQQELKDHEKLKIEGKFGAMKAMKDLGILIPMVGNGKNKQK